MWTCLLALGLVAALQVPSLAKPSNEITEIVNKHNNLRRGVEPTASNMLRMSWNNEAAANAQKWADMCSMKRSPDGSREISTSGCGENLYMASNKDSWTNVIQTWYDEVKDFRYGVGSTGGEVQNYTQVVWYRSNQVGCAMAYCPNYKYFYICHYCPPANLQLAHPYKSGTPCDDCSKACDDKLCTNPCPYADQYGNCPEMTENGGCSKSDVASLCPASCKCSSEII